MNISATLIGYVYAIWLPVYLLGLFAIYRNSQYGKVHIGVGIIIYPFIVLTPVYLILLATFQQSKTSSG